MPNIEKNNTTRNYHDQVIINNELKLRELQKKLPWFCKDFFRGIEPTTSSRTRIGYGYDLIVFFNYLKENNPDAEDKEITSLPLDILDKITATDIEEYLEYLKYYVTEDGKEHINKERGIMRKLACLRTLYKYFYKKEMIKTNPASIVSMPKIHEKEIIRLDADEVGNLLDEVDTGDKLTKSQQKFHAKTKTRDLAILTLLLGTGIRVSECAGIRMCDVDFEKEYNFQDGDLLLLISINGNTFYFDKRVVHHILKCSVNTWLISCKDNINFSKNYLYIPTLNDKYNDYLLRHILDFILMY